MSDPSLDAIRAYVSSFASIPDDELAAFASTVGVASFAPGELFTRIGDTHDRVGIVLRGVFRVYYLSPDGDLFIRNFCKEGMPIGSYATILTAKPAHVNIEALEPSTVAQFRYAELARRFDRHPAWERVGRRIAEEHYIARERREYHLLAFDAATRYEHFLRDFPGLDQRITQANVASYVGVAPETLSRLIRKRKP
jgi:CRP-like cAMP-binding protein